MNQLVPQHAVSFGPAAASRSGGDTNVVAGKPERRFAISHYLNFIRRQKWIILGGVLVALVVGLGLTLLSTREYTSSSTIEIQRENLNIVRVKGVEPDTSPIDQEFYQTQYGLLKSEALSRRVAEAMRLYDNAHFFAMFKVTSADKWFEGGRVVAGASTRERRIQEAGKVLIEHLDVSPLRLSRLVDVSFTAPDAQFARQVVEAWNQNFIDSSLERRMEATEYARRYLEKRLTELRGKLDESERQLVSYATQQ